MNKYSNKNAIIFPLPSAYDLFGEVPVTKCEVIQWVEVVARLPHDSKRFEWYVKNWAVVEKIKRVKVQFCTLDEYFDAEAANNRRY